jgi:hypothetical protein
VYGFGHVKIYEEIVACLNGTRPYPVTYEDTLATIRLLNSLYVAHESRSWVDVAAAGDSSRLGRPDDDLAGLYRSIPPPKG